MKVRSSDQKVKQNPLTWAFIDDTIMTAHKARLNKIVTEDTHAHTYTHMHTYTIVNDRN